MTWALEEGDPELVPGPAVIHVWGSTNPGQYVDEGTGEDIEEFARFTIVF